MRAKRTKPKAQSKAKRKLSFAAGVGLESRLAAKEARRVARSMARRSMCGRTAVWSRSRRTGNFQKVERHVADAE
jgi:hypothetical protein